MFIGSTLPAQKPRSRSAFKLTQADATAPLHLSLMIRRLSQTKEIQEAGQSWQWTLQDANVGKLHTLAC